MIIVSQNKEKLVNFSNVDLIVVRENKIISFDNTYTDVQDGDLFGTYKNKERAKEVFQEIIQSYRNYRTAECDGYTNVLQETAVYEMPEE